MMRPDWNRTLLELLGSTGMRYRDAPSDGAAVREHGDREAAGRRTTRRRGPSNCQFVPA